MSGFVSLDQAMRQRQKERRSEKGPQRPNGNDPRPVIRLEANNLEAVVNQAEAALIASGRGLYQRGNAIVSVGTVKVITADKQEVAAQRVFERGDHALFEDLTCAAVFEKWDGRKGDYKAVEPPMKVVHVLKERTGRLRFPVLTGVISAPTLRSDGSILDAPGYDRATGLLFDPGGAVFDTIPAKPTRAEAERALIKLDSLIDTFPFVGDADRSVSLAALLTAMVRRSLRTAPLFGFSAPVAGSGKSMQVDIVSILATGREAGVLAQGKTDEETEKRLASVLIAGDAVIAVDNCEAPLGGDLLCQALTQSTVRIRILGRSETIELPTGALITATGNNLTLVGDMTRRALLCKLDPQVERPELRTFAVNPIALAKAERGTYVATALTILRAYVVAGRPRQVDPLGSFEEWSNLVRSALVWLGRTDPVETMESARQRDPKLDELQTVMPQWWRTLSDNRTSVRDVIAMATEKTKPNSFNPEATCEGSFIRPDFREALLAVAGQGGVVNGHRLGKWLGRMEKRIAAVSPDAQAGAIQLCFERVGLMEGVMTWSLREAKETLF